MDGGDDQFTVKKLPPQVRSVTVDDFIANTHYSETEFKEIYYTTIFISNIKANVSSS